MLYVLFGEMGIGKNYVGERLATHLGCEFFDGDLVVPQSMAEKVMAFKPLSLEDIDDYVHNHLIGAIEQRLTPGKKLVVAQALYLRQHRDVIRRRFSKHGVKMVYLPVPSRVTHMKRLYSRENGLKWAAFGLFNAFFFERPRGYDTHVIVNETGGDLPSQFKYVIGRQHEVDR